MPQVFELEEEALEQHASPTAYPEDQAVEFLECLELLGETPSNEEAWDQDMEAFGVHLHAG